MADFFVEKFTDVASQAIAAGDFISVGELGLVYKVYGKLNTPVTNVLGSFKKKGTLTLVPIDRTFVRGETRIYDTSTKAFTVLEAAKVNFHLGNVNYTGNKTQAQLQAYYDANKPKVINSPAGSASFNFQSLYKELANISVSNYVIVMFNDRWYWGNKNYISCSIFNASGKSEFSASIDYIAIPNR